MIKTWKQLAANLCRAFDKDAERSWTEEERWGIILESTAVPLSLVFLWCQGRQWPSKVLFWALSYPPKLKQEQKTWGEPVRDTEQVFWPSPREVGDGRPRAGTLLSLCLATGISISQCLPVPQAGLAGRVQAGGTHGGSANESCYHPDPELVNHRELGWQRGQGCHLMGRPANTVFKPCPHEVSKTCWARQTDQTVL